SLTGNNFFGNIPPEIFSFPFLEDLLITDVGNFNFQLPQSENLISIVSLVLRNCTITGSIPLNFTHSMRSLRR
ncbi:LRR domain containing protein, partial [Parasponia andersonii]